MGRAPGRARGMKEGGGGIGWFHLGLHLWVVRVWGAPGLG